MSKKEWYDWRAFLELEPPLEDRISFYFAAVVATLININRDTKKFKEPIPMEKFRLTFGDEVPSVGSAPTKKMSTKDLWAVLKTIAMEHRPPAKRKPRTAVPGKRRLGARR